MHKQENQSVKQTNACYMIKPDDDLPEYGRIFIIVENCPYCGDSHFHGPTTFLRGEEDPDILIQKQHGTQRRACCQKGEYILNLSKTLPQD